MEKKGNFMLQVREKKQRELKLKKKKTVPNLCGVEPFFWTKVQAILKIPP